MLLTPPGRYAGTGETWPHSQQEALVLLSSPSSFSAGHLCQKGQKFTISEYSVAAQCKEHAEHGRKFYRHSVCVYVYTQGGLDVQQLASDVNTHAI